MNKNYYYYYYLFVADIDFVDYNYSGHLVDIVDYFVETVVDYKFDFQIGVHFDNLKEDLGNMIGMMWYLLIPII